MDIFIKVKVSTTPVQSPEKERIINLSAIRYIAKTKDDFSGLALRADYYMAMDGSNNLFISASDAVRIFKMIDVSL